MNRRVGRVTPCAPLGAITVPDGALRIATVTDGVKFYRKTQ
jgi:hypothetical protein